MFDSLQGAQGGDEQTYANPKAILNHLLIMWSIDYIEYSPTRFTKPGQAADVVIVDVVDLDLADPNTGQPGLLSRRNWWRQARLIRELKKSIGSPTPKLGWMVQGIGSSGYPPYELRDASADPSACARGEAWLRLNPGFKPSEASMVPIIPQGPVPPMTGQMVQGRPTPQPQYAPPPPSQLEQLAQRANQQPMPPAPPMPPQQPWPQPQQPQWGPTQDQGEIPF